MKYHRKIVNVHASVHCDQGAYLFEIQWQDPAPEAEVADQLLRAAAFFIDL